MFAPTGYGTAARAYVHAFHQASIDMSVTDISFVPERYVRDPLVNYYLNRNIDPELHLCHGVPHGIDDLQKVFSRLIVMTAWEADALPRRHADVLNQVMEVWVPCRYDLEVFQRQLKVPVFLVPHPVRTLPPPCFSRAEINRQLGLKEDSFVFFSTGSWQERKNLLGVLDAFLRAFPDEPDAILLIKTYFGFASERMVHALIAMAIERANSVDKQKAAARIQLCGSFLPEECMTSLAQRADCYVSLYRGEGWCYPLFDAACNGTPVIATAYSGPMDYLDPRYHRLVRYELTPAIQRYQKVNFAFTPEMSWAEPDVLHAAELMRDVYDHREQARKQAEEGAILLRQKYSPLAVGRMAAQRLTEAGRIGHSDTLPASCAMALS
jgi:glycosyltransferase involved in cell wall biosynthesis